MRHAGIDFNLGMAAGNTQIGRQLPHFSRRNAPVGAPKFPSMGARILAANGPN